MHIIVAAFYHFARFPDPSALRGPLYDLCRANHINGTILLAPEGVNGTIAGSREGIDVILTHLRQLPGCAALERKEGTAKTMPFHRMKVRLKREIVTMGQPQVDPMSGTGHYVEAKDWNALVRADDVVLIDTRNDYEVEIGTFQGAENPQTDSFSQFPTWWENNKDRFQGKRIAMFCTGGIRCEKSTNYLIGQGVPDVFHLKGGILKYLETVPETDSTWAGECFVFDARVSVGHGLKEGNHDLCHGCRQPVSPADRNHPDYERGVSCPKCRPTTDPQDLARYRERQKQVDLARERGESHIGQRQD